MCPWQLRTACFKSPEGYLIGIQSFVVYTMGMDLSSNLTERCT